MDFFLFFYQDYKNDIANSKYNPNSIPFKFSVNICTTKLSKVGQFFSLTLFYLPFFFYHGKILRVFYDRVKMARKILFSNL